MAFDYKKAYPALYLPKAEPSLVTIPPMNFLAVRGKGDPNDPEGAYQTAVGALYAVAFTIKMSKLGGRGIEGYFDYVVPPLEGFWRQDGVMGVDFTRKRDFQWISCIRLPEFVTPEDFRWAADEAVRRKGQAAAGVEWLTVDESLCVQMMHIGSYDDEPASVAKMEAFIAANGLESDFGDARHHHEIYLSDPRRVPPERRKTVLRHPVRHAEADAAPFAKGGLHTEQK